MKLNKKAILGMLVAMVLSLGITNGMNAEKQNEDINVQQCWAAMMAYGGGEMSASGNFATGAFGAVMSTGVGFLVGGPAGLLFGL